MTPRAMEVRLARTVGEREEAQQLRYRVFHEERGATGGIHALATRRDVDAFDAAMDHLVVIDHARTVDQGRVVGNYRLLRGEPSAPAQFYSSEEFDLGCLLASGCRLLELGRSCVLAEYRSLHVMQMLWSALAAYVAEHRVELMFGCASLQGTDPGALRDQLAYLHHYHLAPGGIRPVARGPSRVAMDVMDLADIDTVRARAGLEPLVKGYLRLGAGVGAGAVVDHAFNTVDVCMVLPTRRLTQRYLRHYEAALGRPLIDPGAALDHGVVADRNADAA